MVPTAIQTPLLATPARGPGRVWTGPAARIVAVVALAGIAWAGDGPAKLSPEQAKLLSAAQADLQDGKPQEAVDRLNRFSGDSFALRHLLLGHAYSQLSRLPEAEAAYERALAMDPGLDQAAYSLAHVCARLGKWPRAAELLGRFVAIDTCDADALYLYAQVAWRLEDHRLCRLLVTKGIVRFPLDIRFRRLDLAALVGEGGFAGARRAALRLLAEAPTDPRLWQQLAYACGQTGRDADRLAALEAGLLCTPTDLQRHRRFLAAHLAGGDWLTAIKHGGSLLAGAQGRPASAHLEVMELLIRAADMGEQDELLAGWLGRVAEKSRTRAMRLAAARSALRQGKPAQARQALGQLIAAGETSSDIFLWAGHLAERAGDGAEAETLYDQARKSTGPSARLATLYLARLWFDQGRNEPAVRLLRGYLDARPEDAPARALLALIEGAGETAKTGREPKATRLRGRKAREAPASGQADSSPDRPR